jgi:hypothetical protein
MHKLFVEQHQPITGSALSVFAVIALSRTS